MFDKWPYGSSMSKRIFIETNEHYESGCSYVSRYQREAVTDEQIRQLREEAIASGDDRQVDYCDVALAPHRRLNEDGSDLVWPWNGQPADRDVARRVCADAINNARAQEVE